MSAAVPTDGIVHSSPFREEGSPLMSSPLSPPPGLGLPLGEPKSVTDLVLSGPRVGTMPNAVMPSGMSGGFVQLDDRQAVARADDAGLRATIAAWDLEIDKLETQLKVAQCKRAEAVAALTAQSNKNELMREGIGQLSLDLVKMMVWPHDGIFDSDPSGEIVGGHPSKILLSGVSFRQVSDDSEEPAPEVVDSESIPEGSGQLARDPVKITLRPHDADPSKAIEGCRPSKILFSEIPLRRAEDSDDSEEPAPEVDPLDLVEDAHPGLTVARKERKAKTWAGLPSGSAPPGLELPGLPSKGSELHGTGNCRPCAWFWKKDGCVNGAECFHCHQCPEGEIKKRKKAKVEQIRLGLATPKNNGASEQTASHLLSLASML